MEEALIAKSRWIDLPARVGVPVLRRPVRAELAQRAALKSAAQLAAEAGLPAPQVLVVEEEEAAGLPHDLRS